MITIKGTNEKLFVREDTMHLVHTETGDKALHFHIPMSHETYKGITYETEVEFENIYFTVKEIEEDEENDEAYIVCKLSKDDFKVNVHQKFLSETKTLSENLQILLQPIGWSFSGATKATRRTIDLEDVSDEAILLELEDTFQCVFEFDNKNKNLEVIYPKDIQYKGLFVSSQVNAEKTDYSGDSYDFVTRLYAYGAVDEEGNRLNFSSINDGKEYVENLNFSKKIVSKIWSDERYTDEASLLEVAKETLAEISQPSESYKITIIDLAKLNDEEYSMYDFSIRDLVDYADLKRDRRVRHRIVETVKYPYAPEKNEITLSSKPLSIEKIVNDTVDHVENMKDTFLDQAKLEATQLINAWATKGYRYETENETYFLDALPKEKAKNVLRINLGGIAFSTSGWAGPYHTAWTIDGKFNADFINTGTLKAIKLIGNAIEGGSININNMFTVGSDGRLKCVGADFQGKVTSTSGRIGNWEIVGNGLQSSYTKTLPNYTDSDAQKINQYLNGQISLTDAEIEYLDIGEDGVLNAADYFMMKSYIQGSLSKTWKYTFFIDGTSPKGFIKCNVDRGNGTPVTYEVNLISISLNSIRDLGKRIRDLEVKLK